MQRNKRVQSLEDNLLDTGLTVYFPALDEIGILKIVNGEKEKLLTQEEFEKEIMNAKNLITVGAKYNAI